MTNHHSSRSHTSDDEEAIPIPPGPVHSTLDEEETARGEKPGTFTPSHQNGKYNQASVNDFPEQDEEIKPSNGTDEEDDEDEYSSSSAEVRLNHQVVVFICDIIWNESSSLTDITFQ